MDRPAGVTAAAASVVEKRDFEVCQSKIDEPGHLIWACVADMKNTKYFSEEEARRLKLNH